MFGLLPDASGLIGGGIINVRFPCMAKAGGRCWIRNGYMPVSGFAVSPTGGVPQPDHTYIQICKQKQQKILIRPDSCDKSRKCNCLREAAL